MRGHHCYSTAPWDTPAPSNRVQGGLPSREAEDKPRTGALLPHFMPSKWWPRVGGALGTCTWYIGALSLLH